MPTPVDASSWQFRDQFYSFVPPWLQTDNAEKYFYVMERMRDLLCQRAYEAMTIRLPVVGDYSNLPYLAFDRALVQGPAETSASFSQRLAGAFEAWTGSGSALAVIGQLQAYLQNLQPGVDPTLPMITIVGNSSTVSHNTWNQVYQGTPIGAPPTRSYVTPSNYDWDGDNTTWRNWLILPMALVSTGLSGSAGATSTAAASACFAEPGQNVNGVWVPATTGTPVNSPWLTLTGLTGLTSAQVGQWITITGSTNAGNNGCFQITEVVSSTSCVIANPDGVPSDAGPLTWTIGFYPFIGPGPAWGQTGYVWGQGELQVPVLDSTALSGTFDVTNGSATVPTSVSQVGAVTQGSAVQFSSQPGVTYGVVTLTSSDVTLCNAYSGTTDATATATVVTVDTGANIGGIWQSSKALVPATSQPTISWGLNCSALVIQSIRALVKTWKSSGTFYDSIIIPFDAGNGAPGCAYSPNSTQGAGNPDGTFGGLGENVNGVWVPNRIVPGNPLTPYLWDTFCQGTGTWEDCTVENVS
jgi:hypothetical protein